jgi:hypothetical protein
MSPFSTHSDTEIRGILARVCQLQEVVILATPYLRFESNFLAQEGDVLIVRNTLGAADSVDGLRSLDLRLRFPDGVRFLEGQAKLLGLGEHGGRRALRLASPKGLLDAEQRRAYRVFRVPKVQVTFSTPKYQFRPASLINLSVGGASLYVRLEPLDEALKLGDRVALSIPLTPEIQIDSQALVRWTQGSTVGLEFDPALDAPLLPLLSRWIFLKREEDKGRPDAQAPAAVSRQESSVVLVTSSMELETLIHESLPGTPGFHRIEPTAAALKGAMGTLPGLVCFHVQTGNLDERRRLKTLMEMVGARTPVMLLGTMPEANLLYDLGSELKAAAVYDVRSNPGPLFQRLVQGILRRYAAERPS